MATKDDGQKKLQQKEGEDNSGTKRSSFTEFFRGLESLLNTVITVEEGEQEQKYEGELNGLAGRLKTGFSLSIKTNLLDTIPRQPSEPARVITQRPMVEAEIEPFVDFFDEQDHVLIVVELPGVAEADIHIEVNGDIFILSTTNSNRAYTKEIVLPENTDASTMTKKYTNGILEIRMSKTQHD